MINNEEGFKATFRFFTTLNKLHLTGMKRTYLDTWHGIRMMLIRKVFS